MDEIKLKYFISVARHLNFTKAAEDCHVTQSTMSKQISALEHELGAQLFARNNREVTLTPAGARLANDAEDYMEQYRIINDSINKLHLEYETHLAIGVGPWESLLLPPILSRFTEKFPSVEMHCTLYTHKRMASHFRSSTFDVGVCSKICTDAVSGLVTQPIGTFNLHAVARADSDFWEMSACDRSVLKNQTIITLYENEYEPVRPYCTKNNMQTAAFTYSNMFHPQIAMVRANMGIAFVPEFYKNELPPDLRMENVLENPCSMDFVAAYNPAVINNQAERFLAVCRELQNIK